ncbi:MAG TPA: hypothetical protein VJM11_12740 [Nevskiaceae bacterium]|nr:hypothetical protein [Nevskiaceae bacterium]
MSTNRFVLVGAWGESGEAMLTRSLSADGTPVLFVPFDDSTATGLDPEADLLGPLEAAWHVARSAIAAIRADGGGALTFVIPVGRDPSVVQSSIAGGLEMLVRALAAECGGGAAPVRVNAVTGDPARAEQVATLAAFVTGPFASFVSGQMFALRA